MNPTEQLQAAIARNLANVGKSSTIGRYVIPPGESRTHKGTGVFAYIVEANGKFKLRLDGQAYVDARAGSSLKATGGAFFEWIEILNTHTAQTLTVVIYTGFAEYRDERLFALEPLTDSFGPEGWDTATIDGTALPVTEQTLENVIRRKALIVGNTHATQHLFVTDASGRYLAPVWPRSTAIIHSAGTLIVENPAGGATPVEATIGEIYWVWYPFPVEEEPVSD